MRMSAVRPSVHRFLETHGSSERQTLTCYQVGGIDLNTRRMFNIDGEREQANWDLAPILELQKRAVQPCAKTGRASYCKRRKHVKQRSYLPYYSFSSSVAAACPKKETVSGSVSHVWRSHTSHVNGACGRHVVSNVSAHARGVDGRTAHIYIYILEECLTLMASGSKPTGIWPRS